MNSLALNTLVVATLTVQRLVELVISGRHRAALRRRGVAVVADPVYPAMVAVHVGLLIGCGLEPWLLDRPFAPWVGWPALALLALAQLGRFWVLRTLGEHWNARIMASGADGGVVTDGPYRFVRHPNYTVVIAETLLLPLIHGAWWTLLVVQIAHAPVLWLRIRSEERSLMAAAEYRAQMAHKPRFLPRWAGSGGARPEERDAGERGRKPGVHGSTATRPGERQALAESPGSPEPRTRSSTAADRSERSRNDGATDVRQPEDRSRTG